MTRVPFETMQEVIAKAFKRIGMSPQDAGICAYIHTQSSCDGVYSHGLNRVPRFIDYVRHGWVDINGKLSLVRRLSAIEVYDGQFGPGVLNAIAAVDQAMSLASAQGVGIVALRNTTHWMRGGAYGWRAVERGYVAICWTNTESCMPAWGAKTPRLGNNPFVMAVPRTRGPLILDMAMSQYSYGKLQVTRLRGERLPFPGGFDADGRLTCEPGSIEASMRILPMGYWKGAGFAIMLDALAAILSEGSPTHVIDTLQRGGCTGCSQVFIVFDPRHFGGEDYCEQVAGGIADYVTMSTPAKGVSAVQYPGQDFLATRQDHLARGIVVDDEIWAEVMALASSGGQI